VLVFDWTVVWVFATCPRSDIFSLFAGTIALDVPLAAATWLTENDKTKVNAKSSNGTKILVLFSIR